MLFYSTSKRKVYQSIHTAFWIEKTFFIALFGQKLLHLVRCLTCIQPMLIKGIYGKNCTVVIDDYLNRETTKTADQERRVAKRTSRDMVFNENTPTTTPHSECFAYRNNKRA